MPFHAGHDMDLVTIVILTDWFINSLNFRILNLFAMLAAAGGFGSIYLNKEIAGKKHFTTWHGFFGLLTCIGVLLAGAGGLLAKYNSWIKNYVRPINVKLYHATGALLGKTVKHVLNISLI